MVSFTLTNGLELAKEACNKAIQLDSRNGLAHISRLWISMHEKDFEKSKQLVKDAKDINPYEPFLLATIGFYYVFSDSPEPELSKQYIEKAINYNSKPQFWYYMALEEYYMLKNDFQKALELSLKSPELEWRTPTYHWILGDEEIALKKFKEYCSKNPSRAEFIKEELGKGKESKALYLSSNPTFEKASKDLLQAYLELETETKE